MPDPTFVENIDNYTQLVLGLLEKNKGVWILKADLVTKFNIKLAYRPLVWSRLKTHGVIINHSDIMFP